MSTLAAFKRHLKTATEVEVTNHKRPHVSGTRKIMRVQPNAFTTAATRDDGTPVESWFRFPPAAKEVSVSTDGLTLECRDYDGTPFLVYRLIKQEVTA